MSGPQLTALSRVLRIFERHDIESWLFGGWAVDFHLGVVTRPHADLDLAVRVGDLGRIAELLLADGWSHAPEDREDGYTGYVLEGVRLELAFLLRAPDGRISTPLREGFASWPDGAFGDETAVLAGVRARLIGRSALEEEKSVVHDDPLAACKDRADLARLRQQRARTD